MLILSRHVDKSVVITVPPRTEPTEIRVTLVELRGDKARIGFTAPRFVIVDREEITERKRLGIRRDRQPTQALAPAGTSGMTPEGNRAPTASNSVPMSSGSAPSGASAFFDRSPRTAG